MSQINKGTKDNTFDAGVFGKLRYDFTAFGGVTGIIPDPSDQLIQEFIESQKAMLDDLGIDREAVNSDDPEEVQRAIEEAENIDIAEQQAHMVRLVAKLTQDSPGYDEIMALPFRIRQRYLNWIQRSLLDPEAQSAGTTTGQSRRTAG